MLLIFSEKFPREDWLLKKNRSNEKEQLPNVDLDEFEKLEDGSNGQA